MADDAIANSIMEMFSGQDAAPQAPPASEIVETTEETTSDSVEPEVPVEAATVTEEIEEITDPETPEQLLKGIVDPASSRGKQIWDSYQFTRQLAKPDTEGGIGHEPTIEDIKTYHDDHLTLNQILTDFETQPDLMFQGLVQINPEAAANLVEKLPDVLAALGDSNPHIQRAYGVLYDKMGKDLVQGMVAQAREHPNADMKKWLFSNARNLQYYITGGKEELKEDVISAPVDPFAAERQRLAAERKALEDQRKSRDEQTWNGFKNDLFGSLGKQLEGSFAWPKELKESLGGLSGPVLKDAMDRVRAAVGKSAVARQELDMVMSQAQRALRSGTNPSSAKEAFVKTYLKYARPHIAAVRAEVLKAGKIKVGASAPAAAPAKTATTVPSPSKAVKRNTGESYDDFAVRSIMGALQ